MTGSKKYKVIIDHNVLGDCIERREAADRVERYLIEKDLIDNSFYTYVTDTYDAEIKVRFQTLVDSTNPDKVVKVRIIEKGELND